MGAFDIFETVATGKGAHAAMAYTGKDPMLFVAHVISALQTIVARDLESGGDCGLYSLTLSKADCILGLVITAKDRRCPS